MKRHGLKILLGIAVLAVAIFAFYPRSSSESADLIVRPERGPFEVTVTTTGELQAKNSVKIYGPSNARQARIYKMSLLDIVPEGTIVQKGEFVAELDRSEINSKIKDVEIDLQKARSKFTQTRLDTSLTLSRARDDQVNLGYATEEAKLRREESVYEPPSVRRKVEIDYEKAQRTFDQSITNYQTLVQQAVAKMEQSSAERAKAERAKEELLELSEAFTINAPENGMVIYRRDWSGQKLTAGGQVNAWDPVVATLPDLSVMESRTYVNEVDIQKIQQGQTVAVTLDADPDRELRGTVTEIANIGEQRPNSDAKVFEVKIEIAETDSTLRPAMTTGNAISVAEVADALFVPLECLHAADSLSFVFVKVGGGPRKREVRLGLMNENEVIVEEGLSVDDRVYLSIPPEADDITLDRLPAAAAEVVASTTHSGSGAEAGSSSPETSP